MINKKPRNLARKARHYRLRKKLSGTATTPRLNVFRSNSNIYAQIIDDELGTTIVSASTLDKDLDCKGKCNVESAAKVGEAVAKKAIDKKIESVVFDRGGYKYHGKVKALADAAREAGLKF
ncbi:MAG: 50S ribosomal protein L18 [Bacilli bacterium]